MKIKLKLFYAAALAVGVVFLQSGCTTPAKRLDEAAVRQQLTTGRSLREVRQIFGNPKISSKGAGGRTLDIYNYQISMVQSTAMGRGKVEVRTLSVFYDPSGRLETFKYYVGETRVTVSKMEWRAGRWFDSKLVDEIQIGVTTRDDLIKKFGPATAENLSFTCYLEMHWNFGGGKEDGLENGRALAVALDPNLIVRERLVQNARRQEK